MKTLIHNRLTILILMLNMSIVMNINASSTTTLLRRSKTVSIVDNGFGMVRSTCQIPSDWQLKSNIYTNPYNGNIEQFQCGFAGQTASITILKSIMSQDFNSSWKQMLKNTLGGDYSKCKFSRLKTNSEIARTNEIRNASKSLGGTARGYEQNFTLNYNGHQLEGKVMGYTITTNNGTIMGGSILYAHPGSMNIALNAWRMIAKTMKSNPKFLQRQQMVHQQKMSQIHADGMRNQRNGFNKTQQKMRELQDTYDSHNSDYNQSLKDWGSTENGNSYSTSEGYNDYYSGTSTIENPYTGQQQRAEGYYQYYWVNDSGKVIGTNDPGYDPRNTYGSNWRKAPKAGR